MDGAAFARTVEAELMAKSAQIEHDKVVQHKATTKRKERLRRLQRLKRRAAAPAAAAADGAVSAVGAGGAAKGGAAGTVVAAATGMSAGCDHGFARSASFAVQSASENTQSPQRGATYDIFDRTEQAADADTVSSGGGDGDGGVVAVAVRHGRGGGGGGGQQQLENLNLTHNWDDSEGYYVAVPGSFLGDGARYEVLGTSGKGVYSSVIRVRDRLGAGGGAKECVIKVIRNNEMMKKQGRREIAFLNEIKAAGGGKEGHCIGLLDHFWFRNHLCLSFEAMKVSAFTLFLSLSVSPKNNKIRQNPKPENVFDIFDGDWKWS